MHAHDCFLFQMSGKRADLFFLEFHRSGDGRINRIISPHFDAPPGMIFRAALADEDIARGGFLPAENLDAQAL